MRQIDGFRFPVLISAVRALLLSVDVTAAKFSVTLCTTWTRFALEPGLPLRGRSSKLPVSSKCRTKLSIAFNGIGVFAPSALPLCETFAM